MLNKERINTDIASLDEILIDLDPNIESPPRRSPPAKTILTPTVKIGSA